MSCFSISNINEPHLFNTNSHWNHSFLVNLNKNEPPNSSQPISRGHIMCNYDQSWLVQCVSSKTSSLSSIYFASSSSLYVIYSFYIEKSLKKGLKHPNNMKLYTVMITLNEKLDLYVCLVCHGVVADMFYLDLELDLD